MSITLLISRMNQILAIVAEAALCLDSWKTTKVENKPSFRTRFLNNNDIKSDSEEYKYRCSVKIYYPITL